MLAKIVNKAHLKRHSTDVSKFYDTWIRIWRSDDCASWNILITNKLDALISQIYFWNKPLHVWTVPLSIIMRFSLYIRQRYMSYSYCWQLSAITVWHIPLLWVQWKTPDVGQRNCPKHVKVLFQKQIWEISASSWFYYKNMNTYYA